jgi:hypothetical protein
MLTALCLTRLFLPPAGSIPDDGEGRHDKDTTRSYASQT